MAALRYLWTDVMVKEAKLPIAGGDAHHQVQKKEEQQEEEEVVMRHYHHSPSPLFVQQGLNPHFHI
jgi:hypothetical protein